MKLVKKINKIVLSKWPQALKKFYGTIVLLFIFHK